jgi:PhzF family phenazine biosynthesis protein
MTIPYFEVAAFTNQPFAGNPAGVCLLERDWLPNEQMQAIAAENNLAETAFLVPREDHFELRWMTPTIEVDLCGHATLASAHVLFRHRTYSGKVIRFRSQGGELSVEQNGKKLLLDFPSHPAEAVELTNELHLALGLEPVAILRERDYVAVFSSQKEVADFEPNLAGIAALDLQGLVITGPGDDCDFVSRYFAPAAGIPEDPVTGSTHCTLIPYWSQRLGKRELFARQISRRGGELFCENRGDRVGIAGEAVTYVEGCIHLF